VPIDDVEEVSNYVAAMQHGLRRIKGGFPLSLRLMREIHAILLRGDAGRIKRQVNFANVDMRRVVLRADSHTRRFGCLDTLGERVEVLGFARESNHEKYGN
jgi:Fic family protein